MVMPRCPAFSPNHLSYSLRNDIESASTSSSDFLSNTAPAFNILNIII